MCALLSRVRHASRVRSCDSLTNKCLIFLQNCSAGPRPLLRRRRKNTPPRSTLLPRDARTRENAQIASSPVGSQDVGQRDVTVRSDSAAAPLVLSSLHLCGIVLILSLLRGQERGAAPDTGAGRPRRSGADPSEGPALTGPHWLPGKAEEGWRLTGAEPPPPSPAAGRAAPRSSQQRDRVTFYQKHLWALPTRACVKVCVRC